jgi:hypothetical protein
MFLEGEAVTADYVFEGIIEVFSVNVCEVERLDFE